MKTPLKFAIYTITKFVNQSFESETIQKILKSTQKPSAIAEISKVPTAHAERQHQCSIKFTNK